MKYKMCLITALLCVVTCLSCNNDVSYSNEDLDKIELDIPDRYMVKSGNEIELELTVPVNYSLTCQWTLNNQVISEEPKVRFTPNGVGEKELIVTLKTTSGDTKTIRKTLFVAKNRAYQVIGYYPYYRANYKNNNWDKLTHVIFCFARVNPDGSLDDTEVKQKIATTSKEAHDNGVPVLLSIGGGGNAAQQTNFSMAIVDKSARTNLVKNCLKLVKDLKLDGLDVDFEAWDATNALNKDKAAGLSALCSELRSGLPKSFLLTAALGVSQIKNDIYPANMIAKLDYVNVMSYDKRAPGGIPIIGSHAPYDYFTETVTLAKERGYPKKKILPGIPFFGIKFISPNKPKDFSLVMYKDIIAQYPDAENQNEIVSDYLYYDGKVLVGQKTEYALQQEVGGVMIWEITQDTDDRNKSLLEVIDNVINKK